MATETPLDRFKNVLGGAARALSDEQELELAFTADAPSQSGKHLKVPMPARSLPPEQVAEARGFADSFALRLKHHDSAMHLRGAPQEAVARAVFDAVESARVEALGSRGYVGIADNLAHALDVKLRADPITRARTREEVPLSTALGLMVREALTGQQAPAAAAPGLALVREWVEEKADLSTLALALDDQRAFQNLAMKLLEDLELVEGDQVPEESDEGGNEDEGTDSEQQDEGEEDEDEGEEGDSEKAGLWVAIRTILIADLVMSLDNVIAVAAAAKGSMTLLVLGLAISIPLVIFGSKLMIKLMDRFPIIIWFGAGLIGWVGGETIVSDVALKGIVVANGWLHYAMPALGAALVLGIGKMAAAKKPEPAAE